MSAKKQEQGHPPLSGLRVPGWLVWVLAMLLVASVGAVWVWYSSELHRPHQVTGVPVEGQVAGESVEGGVAIIVPEGATGRQIGNIIRSAGIRHHPLVYRIEEQRRGNGYIPKAGEFLLPGRASLDEALNIIHKGKVVQHAFTIPEGTTSAAFVASLDADARFTGALATPPGEGDLLPETYFFTRGTDRDAFLARVMGARDITLAALWASRMEGLPLRTLNEAVVLASIIEKETAVAGERALVASVFVNRLRAGMKMQSDPTVMYGLEQDGTPVESLRKRHLAHESPWNTYLHPGLPPSPICNPGEDSLRAALNPEDSPYYYFVADGKGGHAFAQTLEEHNRNVRVWRAIRDSAGGADPAGDQ